MKLDFLVRGKLKVDMRDYVKEMLESFPITLGKNDVAFTPASEDFCLGRKEPQHGNWIKRRLKPFTQQLHKVVLDKKGTT